MQNITTLLWSQNSGAAFAGRTIDIGASNYKRLFIHIYNGTSVFLATDSATTISLGIAPHLTYRTFKISNDDLIIGEGTEYTTYGSWTSITSNSYCIPFRIYGIK